MSLRRVLSVRNPHRAGDTERYTNRIDISPRQEGLSIGAAVIDAGVKRLRPVLLTSTTTIAGLLPMAMGWFGSEEFLQPMAVTIVWGLVFSTVLTLLMVPCIVLFDDALRRAVTWPFRAWKSRGRPGLGAAQGGG